MTTNFVPSLLIGNGTDAAATALSAVGDIIMVKANEHTQILTAAEAAALSDNDAVQFLQLFTDQAGNSAVRQSVKLTRKGVENYNAQDALAAVQTVWTISFASFLANSKVKIIISMTPDNDTQPNMPRRYEFITNRITTTSGTGAGSSNAEIARLITQINARFPLIGLVTAAQASAGSALTITGNAQLTRNIDDYAFVDFDIYGATYADDGTVAGTEAVTESGGTSLASAVKTTTATPGRGLPIQIRTMERIARGYEGINNLRQFDLAPPATEVSSSATYDVLVIEGRFAVEGDFQFLAPYPAKVQLAIPVTSLDPQLTELTTIISAWLNKQTNTVVAGE